MSNWILRLTEVGKTFAERPPMAQPLVEVFRGMFDRKKQQGGEKAVHQALKGISFELEAGDVLGIIGSNGAGKSTLLRILAGIARPSEGMVEFRGASTAILDLGSGFHPDLTGRENVYFNARLLGLSKNEVQRTYDQIVAFSEIGEYIDKPVKYYSSGMYLRLAFSTAVHFEREIMIFDEVLAVGDVHFQKKCREKILEMREQGRTIIMVSHNLNEVAALCNKVLELENGTVKQFGDTLEVVTQYLAPPEPEPQTVLSPANKIFQCITFTGVTAFTKNDPTPRTVFKRDDAIVFKLAYEQTAPAEHLHIGYLFMDVFRNKLFGDSTHSGTPFRSDGAGHFELTLTLPPNLFNYGTFRLVVAVIFEGANVKTPWEALVFEVERPESERLTDGFAYIPLAPEIGVDWANA